MRGRSEEAMFKRYRERALEEARQRAAGGVEPELEQPELMFRESFRIVRFG
jgi:hypothetical protein